MRFLSLLFRHQWLIVALALIVAGNFIDVVIDIAVHDTYYVIDGFQAGLLGGLFFAALWVLHAFVPAFSTVKGLSAFHLTATSAAGVCLWCACLFPALEPPRRYTDYSVYDEFLDASAPGMDLSLIISLLLIVLAGLQLIFVAQSIVWLSRRRTR